MTGIVRRYVRVAGRRVHLRSVGRGPLVLLLHQSPQSSADFIDLMTRWADRFTLIAPDRPGCGLSDPLDIPTPDFVDYANALVELLDVLGIERVAVYGFHTGATEALALANTRPARVSAIVANGLVALTSRELADVEANYLPPFVPQWDGSHLAWLWSRMREQTIFFPWHRHTAAARLDYDVSPPERLQRNAIEMMEGWRTYSRAYLAAFRYPAQTAVGACPCPAFVTAAAWDPLRPHLARLPGANARVRIEPGTGSIETETAAFSWLAPYAREQEIAADAPACPDRTFVGTNSHATHCLLAGPEQGPCVMLLHDAGERADLHLPLVQALGHEGWRVVAPDLAGHGESTPLTDTSADRLAGHAARVSALIGGLRVKPRLIIGVGAGSAVAAQLMASAVPDAVMVALAPQVVAAADRMRAVEAEGTVPAPDWYGGHLQMAWHRVRSAALFHPWWSARHDSARLGEPRLDPELQHARASALLRSTVAGPGLAAAAVHEPFAGRLAQIAERVHVIGDTGWPAAARRLAASAAAEAGAAYDEWDRTDDAAEARELLARWRN